MNFNKLSQINSLFEDGLSFNVVSNNGAADIYSPKLNNSLMRNPFTELPYFPDIIQVRNSHNDSKKFVSRVEALRMICDDTGINDDMDICNIKEK